jgi:hypothetical protein
MVGLMKRLRERHRLLARHRRVGGDQLQRDLIADRRRRFRELGPDGRRRYVLAHAQRAAREPLPDDPLAAHYALRARRFARSTSSAGRLMHLGTIGRPRRQPHRRPAPITARPRARRRRTARTTRAGPSGDDGPGEEPPQPRSGSAA